MTTFLASLLSEVEVLGTTGDVERTAVTAVTQDSHAVIDGSLYCCVTGTHVDGHDLAGEVVAAGAASLLVERFLPLDVPQVRVPNTRTAIAPMAAAFYGHPSKALRVVGVTGTNGKTTVTSLVAAIAAEAGRPSAVIGTLSGVRTTPEAPVLQAELANLRDAGRDVVAMEVSSMALDQHRADAISFTVAVWTNLTQDHLDYHGDMASYFEAKARLFEVGRAATAVINVDDPWGRKLFERVQPAMPVVPYGLAQSGSDIEDVRVGLNQSRFHWRGRPVTFPMGGLHNVMNAFAAATTASVIDIAEDTIVHALERFAGVPGRFERVDAGQPFSVLVDYAHTPDAIEQVLVSAREAGAARVTIVFGCGGERDRGKRPRMVEVASRLADHVILTSDNPRHEDPSAIIAEAAAGAVRPEVMTIEPDRAAAIALAVRAAASGDAIVIAGKGHETGQVIGDVTLPFDDREVARAALAVAGYSAPRAASGAA